jgi:acetoacetate decarboxylase
MDIKTVREKAFAMPLTSPAYPPGPYRFINREFFIITYRTDAEKLRRSRWSPTSSSAWPIPPALATTPRAAR